MRKYRFLRVVLITIFWGCLLGLAGCAHYHGDGAVGTIIATSEAFRAFDGEYENTPYFKTHKPESIAVLPFSSIHENLSGRNDAFERPEEIVRKGLYNHISSLPFKDLELLDTDQRLQNAGLRDKQAMLRRLAENPRQLKSILGVDSVVTGDVTHFNKTFVGVYSQVAVGCEVKMWDLESGQLLWRAKHVSRAHAGGLSLNPIGLLLSAAASAWNLRDEEMLSQTDELFREMVSTIELPAGLAVSQRSKAAIDLFAVMNAEKPYTVGQDIAFRLMGDTGCRAYVDLGDYKSAIPLSPVSPAAKEALKSGILESVRNRQAAAGQSLPPEMLAEMEKGFVHREIYEGVYTVSPGEERYGLMAKAYLVNPFGDQVSRIDVTNVVDIDAKPPAAAEGLTVESLDRKVHLRWRSNRETDLAGYEIWTGPSPLSGYTLLHTVEANDITLPNLNNFERFYVKINAVDRAGNQGSFSQPAAAVSLPVQGLYDLPQPGPVLETDIDVSSLLVRDRSPYRVLSALEIKSGATLYVEPGVEIRFSPQAALIVNGGSLLAYGQNGRPVRLSPAAFDGEPGSWRGLALNRTEHVILEHVIIEKAENGLTIGDSAPQIFSTVIQACSQAGVQLKENAKPHITCSQISSNRGQGGMVVEGAGIAPFVRNNTFIGNEPFAVQSYTPLNIDLTGNYWGMPAPVQDLFLGRIVWDPYLSDPPQNCREPSP